MIGSKAVRAGAALAGVAAATLPFGALAVDAWAGRQAAVSTVLGAALATVLAVASVVLAIWAHDKPQPVFLTALLGGFLGRLVLFGGSVALLATATDFPVAAFMAGLFAYYVLFQILEIRALRRLAAARPASLA